MMDSNNFAQSSWHLSFNVQMLKDARLSEYDALGDIMESAL